MQAPILLDLLIKKLEAAGVKPGLIDDVKHLYEVVFREAYKAGGERLEDDEGLGNI